MDIDILDVTIFDGDSIRPENRVSIRDGLITELGTGPAQSPADRVIAATGRLLTPGFVDAHVHTTFGGQESLACDVSGADGLTETLNMIRDYVAATNAENPTSAEADATDIPDPTNSPAPTANWVIGGGWSMADFPGGNPTADLLDAACPDRPAILLSADHHSAWVNTAALTIAGLDATTTAPAGGVIVTDSHGTPTGCLHESAIDLVSAHVPPASDAEVHAGLLAGQSYLNSLGVTAWMDAIVGDYGGHRDPYDTYVRAAASDDLHSEVVGSLWWPREVTDIDAEVAELTARARTEGRFRTTSVKFMLDGIVESRTAAMSSEYSCTCGGRGTSYFTKDHLEASFAALDRAGFDIHCHAIGDAAVRAALDAFAAIGSPRADARHHIAHVQVVDPVDVPRFAQLGVTANLQALWACYDEQMIDLNLPVLGDERTGWLYPFGSFAAAGTHLAMGSDWPVSTANPWEAIHVAVNRSHPGAADTSPLLPEQALDVETALRAYTSGSAHLLRSRSNGGIRRGEPANLALTSANPFEVAPGEIAAITNDLTICAGRIVHDALPAQAPTLPPQARTQAPPHRPTPPPAPTDSAPA
ncbi:amidohydrolase [Brevibacterium spongiae]|uniref:Amidohydrolase n=1 Tax=Brevibacterium spongiae TaxID=2909672 RepID=A0ABY5SSD0_9MICO|nr:amidohydrolase [Brevibacterium spongiae]UVI36791.1 amidohydrolase [Brevibacterium spongiae]